MSKSVLLTSDQWEAIISCALGKVKNDPLPEIKSGYAERGAMIMKMTKGVIRLLLLIRLENNLRENGSLSEMKKGLCACW